MHAMLSDLPAGWSSPISCAGRRLHYRPARELVGVEISDNCKVLQVDRDILLRLIKTRSSLQVEDVSSLTSCHAIAMPAVWFPLPA
jgi:hypothetical protein